MANPFQGADQNKCIYKKLEPIPHTVLKSQSRLSFEGQPRGDFLVLMALSRPKASLTTHFSVSFIADV